MGDNVPKDPRLMATIQAQTEAFLKFFSNDKILRSIPWDLHDGDSALDVPFSFSDLTAAISSTRPTTPDARAVFTIRRT